MNNTQKGSATVWIILIVVVLLIAAGAYFFLNNSSQCTITDNNGNVTHGSCPSTSPGTIVTSAQSDYDKVGQAMKEEAAQSKSTSPSGFLIPGAIPTGYSMGVTGPQFTSNSTTYSYFDKNNHDIFINENAVTGSAYTQNVATIMSQLGVNKTSQDFTYNGHTGSVIIGNNLSALTYDDNGKFLLIQTNDKSITGDNLIAMLKSMTVAQ